MNLKMTNMNMINKILFQLMLKILTIKIIIK